MPLRRHPVNPRCFADRSGRAVYLAGSHTWSDFATDQGAATTDYPAFLDLLESHGHSCFRGWVWDVPRSHQGFNGGPFDWTPAPWLRTGPGLATDGRPRFDLTAWDEAWFARVRRRVELAAERGIVVIVMLFQGFAWQYDRADDDGFPFDGRNNVNGVDAGPADDAATLRHPAVTAAQVAFVTELARRLDDLDTVLWEISNESGSDSTDWQEHLVGVLRALGTPHPIGMTHQFDGGDDARLAAGPADWISPDCTPAVRAQPPVADGRQVIVSDTDHGYDWRSLRADGPAGWIDWAWRCFTRGHHLLFMDPCLARITIDGEVRNAPVGVDPRDPRMGLAPDPFYDPMRTVLGAARRLADSIDLARCVPHPELASSGFCLADPTRELVVWAPDGDATVELPAGRWWCAALDPATAAPLGTVALPPHDGGTLRVSAAATPRLLLVRRG